MVRSSSTSAAASSSAAGASRGRAAPWNAFVLHRYDWSETSLILDLFTREGGRLAVAAKGAKRPSSQYRSVLLPFQRIHVQLSRTRGGDGDEVQALRHAEWAGAATVLRGDTLFRGFYLNELLMKLLPRGDAHPAIFDAYAGTLRALATQATDDAQPQAAMRAFEMMLLRDVGWLPELHRVTSTQQSVTATGAYALRADTGLVSADGATDAIEGQHWLRLQAALVDRDDEALRHACEPTAPKLRAMLRSVLTLHLGSTPLRTRDVALGLQRWTAAMGQAHARMRP